MSWTLVLSRQQEGQERTGNRCAARTAGSSRFPTDRLAPLLPAILLLALAAVSCAPASAAATRTLTVAAASDLQFAFEEIGTLFQQETGAKITFNFGSSGNLATQIANGMPVDIFASADEQYVSQLVSSGVAIPDTEQLYAVGRIALVSNRTGGIEATRLQDLLNPEVRHVAIANPDHAPYGRAARQALETVVLWEQLKPKIVYGENVRQALQFVQTGNADAGIVALSIANVPEVSYTLLDASLHQPLRQSMVVVKGSREEQLARDFVAFANGPKGRPIMEKYGFTLPAAGHQPSAIGRQQLAVSYQPSAVSAGDSALSTQDSGLSTQNSEPRTRNEPRGRHG